MYYQSLGLAFLGVLFLTILCFLHIGNWLALRQEKLYPGEKHADTHITEGAIFALLGLLLAFTFSSAASKFDNRRLLIIDEANAIGTAYLRLDLLPESSRKTLQDSLKQYLDTRLQAYRSVSLEENYQQSLDQSLIIQHKIWNEATRSCQSTNSSAACMLLLPALNSVFDIANTRISNTKLHPHIFVFSVLVGLALLSAVLAGYSISKNKIGGPLHYFCYAAVLALTIFAIFDMEYPRLGFIRVDAFDQVLIELKDQL